MLTLVSGGSASGKSEFAESLVVNSGCENRWYLATMLPYDEECHRRIARHRQMRAKKGFETLEVPYALQQLELTAQVVIVTNELFSDGMQYDPSTEHYLRILGRINCRLAQMADRVYEVVAGIAIPWKGEKQE